MHRRAHALAALPGADQAAGRGAHHLHGDRRHAAGQPGTPAAGCAGLGQPRHRARRGLRRGDQPRARPAHRRADGAHPRPAAAHRGARPSATRWCSPRVLGVRSMAMLALLVNLLTAVLTFASLIGYAVVYTVWLKRATSQNIVIGGAAGRRSRRCSGWAAVTEQRRPERAAAVPHHLRRGRRRTSGRWPSRAATSTRAPASRCCR